MGKLYVVPTPVGNLEDMTFRAIRILKEADLVLAEDTRTSGILLKHFEIKNAMQSHHKFNEHKTVESVVNRIKGGETVMSTFMADISHLFEAALMTDDIEGIILNPWNRALMLDKSLLQLILAGK